MANNNDIEKNANKFSQSRPENGKEFEQMQGAQNQLLTIAGAQKQNLMEQRLAESNLAAQNDIMRQAAELGAMSGGNMYVNQATQGVMGRYGLQKPMTTSSSKQIRTPQGIVINNNTTNITTVPANIGGPIQGRPLQFQAQGAAGESSKFKDWISKAFDKQNEEAKKRNQEYARREVSLTKSSNKIMRKLEEFSRDITKKLDPRNIGKSVGGQIGTIFKLFGMGYLAANTEKILDGIKGFADKTKNFFEWIKGDKKETPKFIKNFTESFKKSFGEIIFGDQATERMKSGGLMGGLKSMFTESLDSFIEKINKLFNERVKLAKSANSNLKFGKAWHISENLEILGNRIVNLISILLGGEAAYNDAISNQVSDSAKNSGKKSYGVADEVGNKYYDKSSRHSFVTRGIDGTVHDRETIFVGNGDTNLVSGSLKNRSYIPRQYVNDDGSISSSAGGTLALSSNIVANMGHKNTAHLSSAFANLYNAAGSGSAMVHQDLLGSLDVNQRTALEASGAIVNGQDAINYKSDIYLNTGLAFDKFDRRTQKEIYDGEYFAFVDPESWWWVYVPRTDDEILNDAKELGKERDYQTAKVSAEYTVGRTVTAKSIQWVVKSKVTREYIKTQGRSALKSAAARAAENAALDSGARMAAMMPKFFEKYIMKLATRKAEQAAVKVLSKEAIAGAGAVAAVPGLREVALAVFTIWGIYDIVKLFTEYHIPTHYRRLMQMQDFTLTSMDEQVDSRRSYRADGKYIIPNKVRICPGFYVDGKVSEEEAKNIAFINQSAVRAVLANAIPDNGHNATSAGADGKANTADDYQYYTGNFGTASRPSASLVNDIHNGTKFWQGDDDMSVDWNTYAKTAESQRTNYVEVDPSSSATSGPNGAPMTSEGNGDFDIQAAVDFIAGHAAPKSTGWCARHVRAALEAGGLSTEGRPGYGGAYGPWLESHGWEKVTDGSRLPGDVEVIAPMGDHQYGHIQMWAGDTYYSDFKQAAHGNVYGKGTQRVRYRYKGSRGDLVSGPRIAWGSLGTDVGDSKYGGSDKNDDPIYGKGLFGLIKDAASKVWEKAKRKVVTSADGTNTEFIGGIISSHRPIDVNSKPLSGITKEIVSKYSGANYTGGGLEYLNQFGIDNTRTDANSRRVLSSLFDKDGKLKVNTTHLDPELAERLKSIETELKKGNAIDIEQINLTAAGIDTTISTSNAQSVATAQAIAGLGGRKESVPSRVSNLGNQ